MFQFDSFSEFIAMAGHGSYVWFSYGLSLLVMVYLVVSPLVRSRKQLRLIRRQGAVAGRRASANKSENC